MARSNQIRDCPTPSSNSIYNLEDSVVLPIVETKKRSFYNYIRFRNSTLTSTQKSASSSRISLSHHQIRWYRQRTTAYRFLQKPEGPYGTAYHLIVSIMILIVLLLTILCTFEGKLECCFTLPCINSHYTIS